MSKATKADPAKGWAALLQAEIVRRETAFPPDAKTIEEIMRMRKAAGVPASKTCTTRFITGEVKAGRIKILTGSALRSGKLVTACRYVLA